MCGPSRPPPIPQLPNRTDALTLHRQSRFDAATCPDGLDSARDLLGSTLDSYLTQVSNRTGKASKGLTVVATLSVPFVVVAGMWGMNFERIPLATHPHGFWLMLALQLGLGVLLIAALRWRRLL